LEQRVMRHAENGRRLYCFGDVEDAELDFCYRNSAALITASYAEGFNLPIVESLSRGRPVLASDIPVHREVAGAHAAYFRPRAAYALADLVWRYERGELRESFRRLDGFHWPDWRQSSRELLDRIVELYSETTRATSL
jgi:glycosyltransferase involved in cell wall biosynthesis